MKTVKGIYAEAKIFDYICGRFQEIDVYWLSKNLFLICSFSD